MEFDFEDIDSENRNLADLLINQPSIVVPLVSYNNTNGGILFTTSLKMQLKKSVMNLLQPKKKYQLSKYLISN